MKIFFLTFFLSLSAYAYIPQTWMILSRTAENHGKGIYKILQTVTFFVKDSPLQVQETWIIESENKMRMEARGVGPLKDKVHLYYVYEGPYRYFLNQKQQRKVVKTPLSQTERYFHFRFSKNIKPLLVALNILPPEALKAPPRFWTLNAVKYPTEPFKRLSRTGGVVNYAFGTPTPPDSDHLLPGLWIEQDHFVIRKLRFPSQWTLTADQYKRYARGLWLPQKRTLQKEQVITFSINHVKPLYASSKVKELLNPKDLLKNKESYKVLLPSEEVILNFYRNFR
ncbi:MAG: hypothetical protein D6797_01500 [Bdellovibrio sp.]|nr:MAG: hypothetical protein D6797_01500 [Bdellovibrio sp.]